MALAFGAATQVADTRVGLGAEVVTLLGGAVGISLLIYAFAARPRPQPASPPSRAPSAKPAAQPRTNRDLALGAGGIGLAVVLLAGLAVSGGPLLAGFGLALLVPMLAGSVYLCVRFFRANS